MLFLSKLVILIRGMVKLNLNKVSFAINIILEEYGNEYGCWTVRQEYSSYTSEGFKVTN